MSCAIAVIVRSASSWGTPGGVAKLQGFGFSALALAVLLVNERRSGCVASGLFANRQGDSGKGPYVRLQARMQNTEGITVSKPVGSLTA